MKSLAAAGCGLAVGVCHLETVSGSGPRSEYPARFYRQLENGSVECELCFRHCVLDKDETGECEIRINRNGELKTMAYGNPGAINIDPVEKKPFFHVLPGSTAFSLATVGCNIDCKFCQNWQIAQAKPGDIQTYDLDPAQAAERAKTHNCQTIAYTYSEPTVWSEYVIDTAKAAKLRGVRSIVVSNGTWSPNVLKELLTHASAIKIDLKSIEPSYYRDVCNAELKPVLDNILTIKNSGVWLELVNLVVTSLNDSEENFKKMSRWIKENLGSDVPLHLTRFHPMYKLKNLPPTPLKSLDMGYEIAKSEGIHFTYVGNVPGHSGQNTLCPGCKTPLIKRKGYFILENRLKNGACPDCSLAIPGLWT